MKKINLQQYYTSSQYFYFFDALFREMGIHKENFLMDNYITPSSYRRARAKEQSVGFEILNHLCELFEFVITPKDIVNKLEKLATRIYNSMNYKIFTTYDDDLAYLESIRYNKYLITPVIELLILFLKINSPKDPKYTIIENIDTFKRIKGYKIFFNEDLLIIYELVELYFDLEKEDDVRIKKYNNAMAYFILASQAFREEKYVEALYFASKSKEICEQEGNIKRIIALNRTIMSSLLYVGNYEECYDLANRQLLILESTQASDNEFKLAIKFLVVASIGIEDYKNVIESLDSDIMPNYNITCILSLIVALYYDDKKTYLNRLNNLIDLESYPKEVLDDMETMKLFLIKKDKNYLFQFKSDKIMPPLLKILKKTTT